jgi:glycine cleavage system protein P-like pyridoxal-binding family
MKEKYETLDEYLDVLDSIKERVAAETEGMNPKQVKRYFAAAVRTLQEATGQAVRARRERRKRSKVKP